MGANHKSLDSFCIGEKQPASPLHRILSVSARFVKFCLVGGSGVLVDMGVLFLLADPRGLGLNITVSKICAAEVALINNFVWNEIWTFRDPTARAASERGKGLKPSAARESHSLLHRFLLFNAICGIGIGLAVFLLHVFHIRIGWNLYVSNLLAIVLVTLWNFGMNACWTWKWKATR